MHISVKSSIFAVEKEREKNLLQTTKTSTMKKETLTFTREELEDINHALLMHKCDCLRENLMALYDAEDKLFNKIKNFLNQKPC